MEMATVALTSENLRTGQFAFETQQQTYLAREIHDTVSPRVVAARLLAGVLKEQIPDESTRCVLNDLSNELALALRDLRTFCFILDRQEAVDFECQQNLQEIVEGFALRANLQFSYCFAACECEMSALLKQTMMRILQEALVNIVRHADATEVHVSVTPLGDRFVLEVRDNGVGISPEAKPGVGLRSILRRARELKGDCQIESGSHGTTIIARLPKIALQAIQG